ncbi:hypothetical protein BGW80DRAFT_1316325 [Lactifluus volemus]|nr:hypothetical protein BGW80DRAFT_1316325 [Lactifluus volemus]
MVSDYTTPAEADVSSPLLPSSPSPTKQADLRGGTLTVHPDGEHYSYAYGPTGLAGLRSNTYALRCAVFASLGGLTFGYDQGVIANVLVMEDFVTPAVLELGCLFGALGAGLITDKVSRRTSIASACGAYSFRARRHRFVRSLAADFMLSPLYMAEISPPEVRGSLLAMEQFSIVLGCVVGFWTGFFTRNVAGSLSWRIPLALQLIPGILLGLGSFALPHSPRLLVLQGQKEAALASLAALRLRPLSEARTDPLIQIELMEMEAEAIMLQRSSPICEGPPLRKEALAWARLFDNRYIDRTLVGVMVMFFQQWTGINALIYYGPLLMRSLGLHGNTVNLLVAGGINIVQFLAVFPAILYIDKWGRKPLLRAGSVAMTAFHLSIALLVFEFGNEWGSHSIAAWIAVACVYLFTAAYGLSFGPIGWVLPNEVFPLSMRGKGAAVSTASNWLNNFMVGLMTPPLMENSPALTFGVFGSACFFAYLWATYIVPETANVSLEMIDEVFRSPASRGDMLMKKQVERDLGLYDLMRGISNNNDET